MSTKQLAAVMLAAAALTAAGCGGSEKAATGSSAGQTAQSTSAVRTTPVASSEEIKVSSGKPLSRSAWIAKGDAICRRTNVKLSTTTATSNQDYARLLPQAAGYERAEATELAKLVPPPSRAADWQHIITNLQKFSEISVKVGEYAKVENLRAARPVVAAGEKDEQEILVIAKRDGFKVCSLP